MGGDAEMAQEGAPEALLDEAVNLTEALDLTVAGADVVPLTQPRAGWLFGSGKIDALRTLSKGTKGAAVGFTKLESSAHPGLMPHRVTALLAASYQRPDLADDLEAEVRRVLGKKGPRWDLEVISNRPAMLRSAQNDKLAARLLAFAEESEIALGAETSLQPSLAGLVPAETAVVCGVAPMGRDVGTPHEAIQRISLAQRALLLTHLLFELAKET